MAPEQHWPFGQSLGAKNSHKGDHGKQDRELHAMERDIAAAQRAAHARMNRLLVGGRAHIRKQGLS